MDRHPFTPAAVSDDVVTRPDPRAKERQLLLLVAITASLPRVLWGLTLDASRIVGDTSDIAPLFPWLRNGGLVIDIVCLVLIGLLHPLDGIVPGTNSKRVAAIAFGGLELVLSFLPVGALVYDVLGRAGFIAYTVPALVASIAFAIWLAALLKPAGKAPMLVAVVLGATGIQVVGQLVFGGVPLLSIAVGVLVAVEVLRVRRTLE